ncbi:hypothetical protein FB567DRAFT_610941 [Paraphoma chrysanthemicola]|uniref:Uncharacterized protein n=1 Tax=Paraphoma chrysanthemicola TaxID=798071 RepID=A0A8K0QW32_9PLEO|nr:hypothetical protein FB567DRAFT_610941 [Paraphoma chrysanthemicola]
MATIKSQTGTVTDANEVTLTPPQQLRANWSLDPNAPLIPSYFHIHDFPPDLFAAVLELSYLTISQADRAWNLLNTYFSARIREASYTGRQKIIYATLQIEDVEKAIDSIKRMRKGQELQAKALAETGTYGHWQSRTAMEWREKMDKEGREGDSEGGRRKYSIRDEVGSERDEKDEKRKYSIRHEVLRGKDEKEEREAKKPKLEIKIVPVSEEKEDDGFPSPPLETRLLTPTPTRQAYELSPTDRILKISKSPIQQPQASPPTPTLHSRITTPAPIPRSHTTTPTPSTKPPIPRSKPLRKILKRPPPISLSLQIPPTSLPILSAYRQPYNSLIDAARQATHQANLLRREAEILEERARVVREMGRAEEGRARALWGRVEREGME